MAKLPEVLVKEFVRMTNDTSKKKKSESFLYGTVDNVNEDGTIDVIFDGAVSSTPCTSSVSVAKGDRVLVMLKNRQAVITANVSRPSMAVDYLETGDAVIRGHLDAVDGTFKGKLQAAIGNFSGSVTVGWQENNDLKKQAIYLGVDTEAAPITIKWPVANNGYTQIFGGQIKVGSTGAYCDYKSTGPSPSSDLRLKKNITPIDEAIAVKIIPVSFSFIGEQDNIRHYGFIAQDVEKVIPDAVSKSENGYLSVSYFELIAPTLALAQSNNKTIKQLEKVIHSLERRVEELESKRNQKLPD